MDDSFHAALPASALQVLRFLTDEAAAGRRGVLVTIVGTTGATARDRGTMMAVSQSGDSRGSLSSGCVEAAIVAEALEALADGAPRTVRFGAGSPYLDIRLPCGGGLELLFVPDPPGLDVAAARLEARLPATVVQGDFAATHVPALRLVVIGQGPECAALIGLGLGFGTRAELLSPDAWLCAAVEAMGATAHALLTPAATPMLSADRWTAIVFLFHDHDWEPALLEQALALPAFYIGAMGSRATHAARLEALAARGVSAEAAARIVSPLGIIMAARDPATLAVSALAQIVDRYRGVTVPVNVPAALET